MAGSHLLSEVSLRRFKAAFKPKAVELQPFNVIIGRNGSGKSTLLEALQWIDTTLRRDAREASDRYQGSRDLINLRFPDEGGSFTLTLKWLGNGDLQEAPGGDGSRESRHERRWRGARPVHGAYAGPRSV